MSEKEAEQFVDTDLIGKSLGSYYTRLYVRLPLVLIASLTNGSYDTFQYRTQGIY